MQAKLVIEKRSLNLASLAWKVKAFGTRKFPVYEAYFILIKNAKKGFAEYLI